LPNTPVPSTSGYPATGSTGATGSSAPGTGAAATQGTPNGQSPAGQSANPPAPSPQPDDGGVEANPAKDKAASFEAPQLLSPSNDKVAHRPTVDVHNAVYRQSVRNTNVSTTVAKPAVESNGWYGIADR
jgi:hypothetical protein